MAQKLALVFALWVSVLLIPLCASGVLLHPCDVCQTECSHEATCSQDPCSVKVSQNDGARSSAQVSLDLALPVHPWRLLAQGALTPPSTAFLDASSVPRFGLPYPVGAFPLLI
jgi:hypothetical protein